MPCRPLPKSPPTARSCRACTSATGRRWRIGECNTTSAGARCRRPRRSSGLPTRSPRPRATCSNSTSRTCSSGKAIPTSRRRRRSRRKRHAQLFDHAARRQVEVHPAFQGFGHWDKILAKPAYRPLGVSGSTIDVRKPADRGPGPRHGRRIVRRISRQVLQRRHHGERCRRLFLQRNQAGGLQRADLPVCPETPRDGRPARNAADGHAGPAWRTPGTWPGWDRSLARCPRTW